MDNFTVKLINFGSVDGKKESQNEQFESLFYPKDSYYNKLLEKNKFLIIGRKGTGKTILAEYYKKQCNKNEDTYCKILDISNFIEKKLQSFDHIQIEKEEMEVFWRYVLLTELGTMIIENTNYFKKKTSPKFRKLNKVLKNRNMILNGATIKNGFAFSYKKNANFNKETEKNYKPASYFHNMESISSIIMKCLGDSKSYSIIYDDVDELEDKVENRQYFYDMMKSLIKATEKLNNEIYLKNSKVILTFRNDIINQLHGGASNLNKVVTECGIKISWYHNYNDSPVKHPIMKMLLHKIRASVPEFKFVENDVIFNELFPTEKKAGDKNLLKFLIDNSFGRPRDVISFLQIYCNKYPEENKFSYRELVNCLSDYSEWFYHELYNEINIHEKKDDIVSALNLIKKYGEATFLFRDLNEYYQMDSSNFKITNLEQTIEELFKLGILGNSRRKSKGKTIIEFAYRDNVSTNANFDLRFTVHYGLRNYLAI